MTKKHDWNKEQPHHVVTGAITTRAFAEKHPEKVEWVKNKKNKQAAFRADTRHAD